MLRLREKERRPIGSRGIAADVDDFVSVVLGQDDRVPCAQGFAQQLLKFGEVRTTAPQKVPCMRRLEFDAKCVVVLRADTDDSRDIRNE